MNAPGPTSDGEEPGGGGRTTNGASFVGDRAQLRLFMGASPIDGFIVVADGHFSANPIFGTGLEGDALAQIGRFVRIGVGLRYEMAITSHTKAHGVFYLPILVGARIPFSDRREIEVLIGAGITRGTLYDSYLAPDGAGVRLSGGCAEASLTYWFPVARSVDLSIGAALRVSEFDVQSGQQERKGAHAFLPFRAGLRWRI